MTSRRIAKVNRAVLESLSSTILFELKDPRVKNVTILDVETTDDMRSAKVHVGVRGDVKIQSLTLHGLESARGFLQAKIADRLQTRYTPVLKFILETNWLENLQATSVGLHEAEAATLTAAQQGGDPAAEEGEEMSDDN